MITNLISKKSGRPVANQFLIVNGTNVTFQSYKTKIADVHCGSAFIRLNGNTLNYSRTTSKYFYQFMEEYLGIVGTKKDFEKAIQNKKIYSPMYKTDFEIKIFLEI